MCLSVCEIACLPSASSLSPQLCTFLIWSDLFCGQGEQWELQIPAARQVLPHDQNPKRMGTHTGRCALFLQFCHCSELLRCLPSSNQFLISLLESWAAFSIYHNSDSNPPSQPSLLDHLLGCQPLRLILAISSIRFVLASVGMFAKRSITLAACAGTGSSIIDSWLIILLLSLCISFSLWVTEQLPKLNFQEVTYPVQYTHFCQQNQPDLSNRRMAHSKTSPSMVHHLFLSSFCLAQSHPHPRKSFCLLHMGHTTPSDLSFNAASGFLLHAQKDNPGKEKMQRTFF